ncbi:HAD family phosphatase [bacterium]|nr:HAD family phosphatase [bacterium]
MFNFKAILFDMDGVIVNSERLWDKSTEILLTRYQRTYEREKSKPLCTGKSLPDAVDTLINYYQLPGEPVALTREFKTITMQLFHGELDFHPGFCEFLTAVKQRNIPCAIATSSDSELLEIVQQKLNLEQYFDRHIYSSALVNFASKPAPDLFLYAAAKLEILPEDCIVIEDAPRGLDAAHNAGMKAIGFAETYPAEMLPQADFVVHNFAELQTLLFKIKLKVNQ